jgi:hypothetical protein
MHFFTVIGIYSTPAPLLANRGRAATCCNIERRKLRNVDGGGNYSIAYYLHTDQTLTVTSQVTNGRNQSFS